MTSVTSCAPTSSGKETVESVRTRVRNVRWADPDSGFNVLFDFDGHPYAGTFRGRNCDLFVTNDPAVNAVIVARVIVDGDAVAQK